MEEIDFKKVSTSLEYLKFQQCFTDSFHKSYDEGTWGGFFNAGKSIIACAFRGEIENVQNLLKEHPEILNEKMAYQSWIYHGNYSSSFSAGIMYNHSTNMYEPSTENARGRMRQPPLQFIGKIP
jgi:hypothetical protein